MKVVFVLLALLVGGSLPARADAVRVLHGGNAWGEGWQFLDLDGVCKVATAAHVVQGDDGAYTPPLVEDKSGRLWTAGAPQAMAEAEEVAAGKAPDVAILPLPAALGAETCGADRLSGVGVARRVMHPERPTIRTWGRSEIEPHPVEVTAAAVDRGGGSTFAVRPTDGARVVEGWSGSPLVDGGVLLGLVFGVDAARNEALVERADVVRRLADAPPVPTGSISATSVGGIGLLGGSSLDFARGPSQLLRPGNSGWLVTPTTSGTVVVQVVPRAPSRQAIRLAAVTLGFAAGAGARVRDLQVYSRADPETGDWAGAASCHAGADTSVLECRFVSRPVMALKLILRVAGTEPLVLTRLDLQ